MSRARVFFSVAALAAALATMGTHAQIAGQARLDIHNVGLPAIDEGALKGEVRAPASVEAIRRQALRTVTRTDSVGSSGVPYKRGRVIVKFKDDVSASARASVVASAASTATIADRLSYTNFDIVNVDPNVDAEAAAQAMSERPEV